MSACGREQGQETIFHTQPSTARWPEYIFLQIWHFGIAPTRSQLSWGGGGCVSVLSETEDQGSTKSRWRVNLPSESLCWPAGPRLRTNLRHVTEAVWSSLLLLMLNHHSRPAPPSHPKEKRKENLCKPLALMSVLLQTSERLVEEHRWPPARRPAVCLKSSSEQYKQFCQHHWYHDKCFSAFKLIHLMAAVITPSN